MKFQDVFLVSDLDGTLIGENYEIPLRNIEAIRRFQQQGGRFSVATGRSINSGVRYYGQVHPKGLCVMLNGSVLYDFETDHVEKAFYLPPEAREYARHLAEHFPQMGYEVFTERELFVLRSNGYIQAHLDHESLPGGAVPESAIPGGWCKVLFAADPETKKEMHAFTETFAHPGARFVETYSCFLEMLPEGVDKGSGLEEILRQTGVPRHRMVAIGDYYNDVEMLRAAGFAAVPSNAPQEIQQMADLVVGDCRGGAVADLIEYLETAE